MYYKLLVIIYIPHLMIRTIFTRMKKEEPKSEEGKEVSTFNLSVMMSNLQPTRCIVTDLTVFDNGKTGSS